MKDSRRQNDSFVALALMVQTFMWLAFTFFDYGFDEKNILDNSDLEDWVGICLIAWLFVFPVFIYFRLRKKYLLTDHPVRDGILRILCWGALCLFISCPIVWAVENDVWIVAQRRSSSGFLDFNGLEYYYIPIIDCIIPLLIIVISLFAATGKRVYRALRKQR